MRHKRAIKKTILSLALLAAFWGPGMTYSIENCTYRPN